MDVQRPSTGSSAFMVSHLPDFFDRFGINFTIDGPQLEYFVYEKKNGLDVSRSLTICLDEPGGEIRMMTFYPALSMHQGCRFLSAACFFMVMQHFANFRHIASGCQILIETRKGVFDAFYALLKDFVHIVICGKGDRVVIQNSFLPLGMDTSMISERPLADQDAE
ncbi:MAG: hypothetical protein AMJ60_05440 [Desulfobacterales bacterium SG8_35]|nr:MAG: hypothetical protein AMJ60_05440 [Desulfobacterales bacterium SG8_35]